MDQMARDYAGKAHFVFVYSREAHPDWYDDRPAPTSYEEKLENARDLRAMFDSPRVHLVDALDGDAHRKYGGVSNMCWVIDHTGRVVYKGGWTIAADVQPVLDALLRMQEASERVATSPRITKLRWIGERCPAWASLATSRHRGAPTSLPRW